MSEVNNSDLEPTRPTKPQKAPEENQHRDEKTRPLRPPSDPENTIFAPKKKEPKSPPSASAGSDASRRVHVTQPAPQPPPPRYPTDRAVAHRSPPAKLPAYQKTIVARPKPITSPPPNWRHWFVRGFLISVIACAMLVIVGLAGSVVTYFWIASQLPPAEELRSRTFQFATTEILDSEGNLLWEIIDPTGGRRTQVTLDQISPHIVNATIATEDRFFYNNVGVDPIAIARAVYYNLNEGEVVSGASTITQQLARTVLLSPEERTQRSLTRKVREAVLAVEINRRYSKKDILEIYLNQIYYGNLAYGIEAAAQTYFGKHASDLTLSEASLLAGLPQSPAIHDPYTNPEGAMARQADVLRLMVEADYITPTEANQAQIENLDVLKPLNTAFEAPHFVTYVRQELEQIVGADYIYQVGLRVQTTLDPRLQALAEEEVRQQIDVLAGRNVTNGALIALDAQTGQILAMVGSKDFREESIGGQINMAVSPRQPGSTIKPLTYLAAFEKLGWTPSTLIMDVPVEYPDGSSVYRPKNYDEKFHGPVSVRTALANSYNIPAIKALEAVGVSALKEIAARFGITTLDETYYGLSLTLGSGEVPLIEMTSAYQALANEGKLVPPRSIFQITDSFGRVIAPPQPQARQVARPEHAYLITHILADNEARARSVGPNSYLRLSRPAAAKTGTTNDFRDNWTIGYTPDIVTGVWVGNADRTPMIDISGLAGAGPIWHNFMERAHEGRPVQGFTRPARIIELEVCADSGTLPSEVCPVRRKEIFYQEQPPLGPEHDIHQLIEIDLNTGLRANDFCRANVEKRYYHVYPADGWEWAVEHGYEQPPTEYCPSTNIVANLTRPLDGSTVRGKVSVEGSAIAANFSYYQVEFGVGTNPQAFATILGPVQQLIEQGILGEFDSTKVDNGPYTLRLVVFDRNGGATESRVRVLVDNSPTSVPSPMATQTPAPTITAKPSPVPSTATPLPTALPSPEPSVVITIAPSPEPSNTPTDEPTAEATLLPTPEPTSEPTQTQQPNSGLEPTVESIKATSEASSKP